MNLLISVLFAFLISFQIYAANTAGPTVSMENTQITYEFSPATTVGTVQKVALNTSGFTHDNAINEETSATQRDNVLSGVIIYSLILLVYSVYWHKNRHPTE